MRYLDQCNRKSLDYEAPVDVCFLDLFTLSVDFVLQAGHR